MNVKPLIPMLNQIGQFFMSQPNREEALQGIADHVRLFWEPRMRLSILEFVAQHPEGKSPDGELLPIVLTALQQHQAQLQPKSSM